MRPQFPFALVLLIASIAIAQPGSNSPEPLPKVPEHFVKANTIDGKYTVHMRASVTTIAPCDPFTIAIHFSGKDKPLNPYGQEHNADLLKTMASFKWKLLTPDGRTYQLAGEAIDGRQKWFRGVHPLGRQATHAIQLDHHGLKTTGAWGGITVKWDSDKPIPKFESEGTYQLSFKGKLISPQRAVDFQIPPVRIKLDKSVQPLKKAIETAIVAQQKHLPNAKLMNRPHTGTGYIRELIHEDKEGNRLIDLDAQIGRVKWGYDLVRVTINPKGEVQRVQQREVFTCVAEGVVIETPMGPRKIEQLNRGDQVWAFDTKSKQRVVTTIRTIRKGVANETLTFSGGLRVTLNHPVFANGIWKPAGQLKHTDNLLVYLRDVGQAKLQPAGKALKQIGATNVFDLTVDKPHNFFAGGVLIHNKSRPWSPQLDDTWYFTWPTTPHKWKTSFETKK